MKKKLMEELELLDSISKSRETLAHFADDVAKLKNGKSMPKYKATLDGIDALDLEIGELEEKAQKEIKDSISYKIGNAMHDILKDFLDQYDVYASSYVPEYTERTIKTDAEKCAEDLAWIIISAIENDEGN